MVVSHDTNNVRSIVNFVEKRFGGGHEARVYSNAYDAKNDFVKLCKDERAPVAVLMESDTFNSGNINVFQFAAVIREQDAPMGKIPVMVAGDSEGQRKAEQSGVTQFFNIHQHGWRSAMVEAAAKALALPTVSTDKTPRSPGHT